MRWKEFLKRGLISFIAALLFSLLFIVKKIKIKVEHIFIIFFVLLSILINLESYLRKKKPKVHKKLDKTLDEIIYKSRWGGLWDPQLAIPYYSWIQRKILEKHKIRGKKRLKISLILGAIWWCIIMSWIVIMMISLVSLSPYVDFRVGIFVAILFLIASPFYYSFLLKRIYWATFKKLILPYRKRGKK